MDALGRTLVLVAAISFAACTQQSAPSFKKK
jgi:hypothetical protein